MFDRLREREANGCAIFSPSSICPARTGWAPAAFLFFPYVFSGFIAFHRAFTRFFRNFIGQDAVCYLGTLSIARCMYTMRYITRSARILVLAQTLPMRGCCCWSVPFLLCSYKDWRLEPEPLSPTRCVSVSYQTAGIVFPCYRSTP